MSAMLQIHTIVSMPFQENTYIVWQPDRHDSLVIDPGLDPDSILEYLVDQNLNVAAILDTHGHADHIAGNGPLKERYPDAPVVIGATDAVMLHDPVLNLSAPFGFSVLSPPADRLVQEGDVLEYAGIRLDVLDLPGHSPGHVVFAWRGPSLPDGQGEQTIVFGGDVLMRGSVGRGDFPGGSSEQLASSIRSKLYKMPDDTVVYPGHGPVTTIGHEKRTNPFVRP
ncbi:MAG: MBL fold metallo-hydrolase [Planctomycetes bacterium]|nr:MBL fold metallo-hydrolase [Planctomycetota bacterium]